MKNSIKHISFLLACLFLLALLPAQGFAAAPREGVYDVERVIRYAKSNWNNGVGNCLYFAVRCMHAGGLDVLYNNNKFTTFLKKMDKQEYGEVHKLATSYYGEEEKRPSVARTDKNKEIAMEGDAILWHCEKCEGYVHIGICGQDVDGYLSIYAHNLAEGNQKVMKAYCARHGEGDFMEVYSYHIYREGEDPKASPTPAPTPTPKPKSRKKK